jgi:hypothetical protein
MTTEPEQALISKPYVPVQAVLMGRTPCGGDVELPEVVAKTTLS